MSPSAVSTSSTLYGSPSAAKRSVASSREISSRVHSRPSASSRSISASICSRSASWIGSGKLEVVVEAVLDRRADRDLHARIEAAHGLGEKMRGRVAEDVERVGIVAVPRRQDLDRARRPRAAAGGRARAAVGADEHGLLRELRPDRARGVEPVAPSGSSSSDLSGRTTFTIAGYRAVDRAGFEPPRAPPPRAPTADRRRPRARSRARRAPSAGSSPSSSSPGRRPGSATAIAATAT